MIIQKVTLHDYGQYGGRNEVELAPRESARPIVLFGGLNGGGKTTLLDAIQLALYGKLARCSNRGSMGYQEYLRRCIHRHGGCQSASVGVQFAHIQQGVERTIHVQRNWRVAGKKGVVETLTVIVDGKPDTAWRDNWAERMEDILPNRISHLFFFDGEEAREYASPVASKRLLQTAIHALLGLDLVDQLQRDLKIYERRKLTSALDDSDREKVEAIREEITGLEDRRKEALEERAEAQNRFESLERERAALEEKFERAGGAVFERRTALETTRAEHQAELDMVQGQLEDLAKGAAPLGLVGGLVERMHEQMEDERRQELMGDTLDVLQERDKQLLEFAKKSALGAKDLQQLRDWLSDDTKARAARAEKEPVLGLAREERIRLRQVRLDLKEPLPGSVRTSLGRHDELAAALEGLERTLADVPDEASIAELLQERGRLDSEIDASKKRVLEQREAYEFIQRELARQEDRLQAELKKYAKSAFGDIERERLLTHASKAHTTLGHFREAVLDRHLRSIEERILAGFQQLLRKKRLVTGLEIDADTFEVTLRDENGETLTVERLSAGERQLFAIAIMWGLAGASGRRLPLVIDTPLGRLDGKHRDNLLQAYYPNASDQVILLSTDTEITKDGFGALESAVGRSYRLVFDEELRRTQVEDGYFWEAAS